MATWIIGSARGAVVGVVACLFALAATACGVAVGKAAPSPSRRTKPAVGAKAVQVFHVVMQSPQDGWGLGRVDGSGHLAILRTTDGGATWADVSPKGEPTPAVGLPIDPQPSTVAGIFPSFAEGWVAAARSETAVAVLHTVDGGRSWSERLVRVPFAEGLALAVPTSPTARLLLSAGPALALEEKALLGSDDGGKTWDTVACSCPATAALSTLDASGFLYGMTFVSPAEGWIAGTPTGDSQNWLYRTVDGGRHWTPVPIPLPPGFRGVTDVEAPFVFGRQRGVLVVGLHAASGLEVMVDHTSDGGVTWRPGPVRKTRIDVGTLDAAFINSDDGWVAGSGDSHLYVTRDGGLTWQILPLPRTEGNVVQVDFVDTRHGWAVFAGKDSTSLWRTVDGGRSWRRLP
jgi:photosystem II stability/assembly factor-like uncharacterized protein